MTLSQLNAEILSYILNVTFFFESGDKNQGPLIRCINVGTYQSIRIAYTLPSLVDICTL